MPLIETDIYDYDSQRCYVVPITQFPHVAMCRIVAVKPGCVWPTGSEIAMSPEKLGKLRRVDPDDDAALTDSVLGRIWDDINR
jgi:hypothetical protein